MSLSPARRRRATLGFGLLSLLASASLATGSPQLTAAAHADYPATAPLVIGSYNIQMGEPMSEFRPAVDFIMSRADVAGLQEAGGTTRRNYLDNSHTWRVYHAPDNRQVPILWNPRVFEPVSANEFKLADGARVEDVAGKDGKTVYRASSYGALVRLRQISTGYEFTFINVHLIHGGVKGGKRAPGRPLLYDVYKQQVASLRAEVASQQGEGFPVYVTGDFNIGFAQDRDVRLRGTPYRNLTAVHEVATWQGKSLSRYGTHIDTSCKRGVKHCGAYIDQTWGPTESASAKVFTHVVHSDHYPIRSAYQIPVPPDYVPQSGTVGFANTQVTSREWNKPYQTRHDPMVFSLTGDLTHGFVSVEVTGGNAVEGRDFTLDDSSLWDSDPTNDRVVVETVPDSKREADKSFTLSLVDPFNTMITQGTATGTILNDD